MPYVAPGTATAGQVYTASAHNVLVGDIIDHESRINAHGCGVLFVSGTSYTPGASNPIPFGTENYDTDGYHDNATNNSRITIPTGLGGTYIFEANVMFNFSTIPTVVEVLIRCNGSMETSKAIRGGVFAGANQSANASYHASGIVYNAVATDYFDVCLQVTGGTYGSAPLTGSTTTVTPTYFRCMRIAS